MTCQVTHSVFISSGSPPFLLLPSSSTPSTFLRLDCQYNALLASSFSGFRGQNLCASLTPGYASVIIDPLRSAPAPHSATPRGLSTLAPIQLGLKTVKQRATRRRFTYLAAPPVQMSTTGAKSRGNAEALVLSIVQSGWLIASLRLLPVFKTPDRLRRRGT